MRILGIDYGDAHIGIAISDSLGYLAGDAYTLHECNMQRAVDQIGKIVKERGVSEIVLGYPKNMNGTVGPRGEKSQDFAALLREHTGLPVTLWDERRTTVDAHRILSENGRRGKTRKNTVDAVAATLILQGYLDFKRTQGQ